MIDDFDDAPGFARKPELPPRPELVRLRWSGPVFEAHKTVREGGRVWTPAGWYWVRGLYRREGFSVEQGPYFYVEMEGYRCEPQPPPPDSAPDYVSR